MHNTEGLINVVDVEATCWPGSAPPGQVSEIIWMEGKLGG